MNTNYFANSQNNNSIQTLQSEHQHNTNMINSSQVSQAASSLLKLQQSQTMQQPQQRSVTPPKRPAVLCRKSSNVPNQNSLLQNSNNKHLMNMPSPIQQQQQSQQSFYNNQMWINNAQTDFINQSSSIQLCSQNSQTVIQFDPYSKNQTSTASNSVAHRNSTSNSSINSFHPFNANQCASYTQNGNAQNNSINNVNNNAQFFLQKNEMEQSTHSFGNSSINQHIHEQSFEKRIVSNQPNSNSNIVKRKNSESFTNNQDTFLNQQQSQQIQQQQNTSLNNSISVATFQLKNGNSALPMQLDNSPSKSNIAQQNNYNRIQTNSNSIVNCGSNPNVQESNLSSVKSENGLQSNNGCQSQQNLQQQQQSQNQQILQQQLHQQQQLLDSSAKNSHKVMIQLSDEIERMNNEIKSKNKEYLSLSEKYDILLEDIKAQEADYQTTLQAKDLLLQQQLKISQRDQSQISTLLSEIERLTQIVKNFPKEQVKAETSGEIRQKIEKLIQMNENLLQENKEIGEENMELMKVSETQKQEIENLKKIVSEQATSVQSLQKKNEKIAAKYQKSKHNIQNENKDEKSRQNGTDGSTNNAQIQKYVAIYEEEIESMKYLLKEKIQEIEYWRCKAQSYQNDYEELEARLQTSLKSNEILNNKIIKFSQFNFMESVTKDISSQSPEKQQSQAQENNNRFSQNYKESDTNQEEEDQINFLAEEIEQDNYEEIDEGQENYDNQGKRKTNKNQEKYEDNPDFDQDNNYLDDRYNKLVNRFSGDLNDDNFYVKEQSNINPYRKSSKYGITSSQYKNRITDFYNGNEGPSSSTTTPLQEFKNSITLRKQNYFTNETNESDYYNQVKHSKTKK